MTPKHPGSRRAASEHPPDRKTLSAGERPEATSETAPAAPTARKPWKPKSPIDVVIGQIEKQERKVAELEEELGHEKASLNKLLQAKQVLES